MFNAESKLISIWEFLVAAAAVFGAVIIPLSIVFGIGEGQLFDILHWSVTGIFLFDIFVNFNTSFSFQGRQISERKHIASKYLRTGFAVDLIAALPLGNLAPLIGLSFITPLIARLFYLNRLLKLFHISKFIKKIASRINPAILRLFMLVFWILLAAHFISCAWAYIHGNPEGLEPGSHYIRSFYWTITTLTTIGYGDITPTGDVQTVFVIVIELLGAAMYGLIIGNIANLIANIDIAKTQHKEKMEKINTFLNYRAIPRNLKRKINNYYEYLWSSRRGYDEASVLEDLPGPLKVSVALYLNREIIAKVPIFEGASEEFIKEVIMHLDPVVYTPGDVVVLAGETGYDMFFISKGSVDVLSADEQTLYNTLHAGQFFGEIALLLSMPRTATIRAREYCDLYRLDKATFDSILKRYPDFAATISNMARKRRAEIEAISVEKQKTAAKNDLEKRSEVAGDLEGIDEEYKVPGRIEKIQHQLNDYGIVLTWEKIKDFRHYEIIKKEAETENWKYLSKRITDSEYCDIDFTPGPNTYRIRAVNISGPGPWSPAYTVKV